MSETERPLDIGWECGVCGFPWVLGNAICANERCRSLYRRRIVPSPEEILLGAK